LTLDIEESGTCAASTWARNGSTFILDESEVSLRGVETWKGSKNLEFEEKKRRTERLTRKRRDPPVVISADEMGPIGTRYEYVCLNVKEVRAQGGGTGLIS